VLYGDLHVVGDKALIVPKVYVAEAFRADVGELGGQHRLALPIEFSASDLLNFDSPAGVLLRQQTAILIEFVKALAYLASDDLLFAREAIECAVEYAEQVGDFEGEEVLYLVASEIARLRSDFVRSQEYVSRALQLNASYARAYIARANIYYDLDDFPLALDYYERAAGIEDQPLGAYVREKANLGIGNIYGYQYQTVSYNELATEVEKRKLAELSLSHYQSVVDSYREHTRPEARLRELTAASWYGLGMVHQLGEESGLAIRAFRQCLELTQDPDLQGKAQGRLDELASGPSDGS
jgi:tetratricopeptide (TPR) repeat protein